MNKIPAFILIAVLIVTMFSPAASAEVVKNTNDNYTITDETTGIRADISRESLDEDSYHFLRGYYNDPSLTNDVLFKRFVDLKRSYINALENLYNTNYLTNTKKSTETAMKIFYEGRETIFGLENCNVYLYNISTYQGLKQTENTHLDLIIPVKKTSSVVMIRMNIPREQLGDTAKNYIASLLSDIRFDGLSSQYKAPSVFLDSSVISKAAQGIFPAASQVNPDYVRLNNPSAGFSILLPNTYNPYIQNSLGGIFSYTSYKINPNQIFSISSEPFRGDGAPDAITRFRVTSLSSVKISASGNTNFGNNNYYYIFYSNIEDGTKKFFYDYYVQDSKRLYKIQLQTALAEPGPILESQMKKILTSFQISKIANQKSQTDSNTVSMKKYLNSEEGYSFKYPENWLLEEVSPTIAYDRYKLIVPGLSGALDITFQESGLKGLYKFLDIMKSVEGNSISSWPELTTDYNPPFAGKTSKLLFSDFAIDGPVSTIYRLSVFADENGRNRLCYSVDILKDSKIYSMFITTGEYKSINGHFNEDTINFLINQVASSFRLEKTNESEERRISKESRNRKLIFTENYLKQLIDPKLIITSVGKIQSDSSMYVTVGNIGDSGYYKLQLDYANKKIEVMDRVLKRDILRNELLVLKEKYEGKKIISTIQNEANMTITIESEDALFKTKLTRIYLVDILSGEGKISWKTKRIANFEDYVWECSLFVKSLFSVETNVSIYGKNVFKDLEIYRQKNLKYRLFVYTESKDHSGFLLLSMNPNTSTFSFESNFIPLDLVIDKIKVRYGIKEVNRSAGPGTFDPETFILSLPVSEDNGTAVSTQQFKIYYNLDNSVLEFEKINSLQQGRR